MQEKQRTVWQCDDCAKNVDDADILHAPNPFNADEPEITGCPWCFSVGPFTLMCDEPGCESTATCGWPASETGSYRSTCHKHWEENKG